jgi:hypothetical protein
MKRPEIAAKCAASNRKPNPKLSETRRRMFAAGTLTANCSGPAAIKNARHRMLTDNPMKRADVVEKVKSTSLASGVYERRGEGSRRFWAENPEFRVRVVERMKKHNPMFQVDTKERSLSKTRQHLQASQLELWFGRFCVRHAFPVWYTGTGQFWVKGRNPDFKVHDRKLVIEVTDGYSRKPERRTYQNYALPTIQHYERHGFACLVVMLPQRRQSRTTALQETLAHQMKIFLAIGESMTCAPIPYRQSENPVKT